MTSRDIALTALFDYGAIQHPDELEPLIDIVKELQPEVVMEIGVAQGGTWYAWAKAASHTAKLIGVDLPANMYMREGFAEAFGIVDTRIPSFRHIPHPNLRTRLGMSLSSKQSFEIIWGDSTETEIIVTAGIAGNVYTGDGISMDAAIVPTVDFLFIDGGHDWVTVSADWNNYGQFVRPGGVVAFHDIADNPANEGAPLVWEKIKNDYPHKEFIAPNSPFGIGVLWKTERTP